MPPPPPKQKTNKLNKAFSIQHWSAYLSVCSFLEQSNGNGQVSFLTGQVEWGTTLLGVALNIGPPDTECTKQTQQKNYKPLGKCSSLGFFPRDKNNNIQGYLKKGKQFADCPTYRSRRLMSIETVRI